VTKKDYELVGNVVRALPVKINRSMVAARFAHALAADNPRFNEVRFLNYCLNESAVSKAMGAGGEGES